MAKKLLIHICMYVCMYVVLLFFKCEKNIKHVTHNFRNAILR
jgi:hypothetical protein